MDTKLSPLLTPTRDDLRALLDRRDGNLAETPFAQLLLALSVHGQNALLELRRSALFKRIVFDAGAPVDCTSNIATETIGRYLVAVGKLSESDYPVLLATAANRGVPLEELLLERQLITSADLSRVLQQNLGRKLLDAFNWRNGTYRISSDVPAVDTTLRVKVPQLIFTGLTKFESQDTIDETVGAATATRFVRAGEPLFPVDDLRFTADQTKIVNALRRAVTLDELAASTGVPEEDVSRILYAMLFMGVAGVDEQAPARSPMRGLELELDAPDTPLQQDVFALDEPAAATPAVLPASPPFFGRRKTSGDEVLRAFVSFKRKDAFDLLDVPEDASPGVIVRAYLSFAETFAPSQFDERDPDGVRDKAQQMFLAAAKAYADLSDDDRRASVIERRRKQKGDETLRRRDAAAAASIAAAAAAAPPPPPPREPEPAALIDPEALYREGRALADAGKLREALGRFEMAADCDAQNGTYAAELAYCRFQLLITTANNALKSLKNVMRIDPNCGAAYLFTGKVHAALGNKLEAEGYLRRAISMMRGDRRPHEALRALAS